MRLHTMLSFIPLLAAGCSDCSDNRTITDAECYATFEPCPPDATVVASCPAGARCGEVTRCGQTSLCAWRDEDMALDMTPDAAPDLVICDQPPMCAPGEQERARCEGQAPCPAACAPGATCREVESCGERIVCELPCMDPLPACEEDFELVLAGTPAPPDAIQTICRGQQSYCGEQWLCCRYTFASTCEDAPPPTCAAGERAVQSCADSPRPCTVRERCGVTIACERAPAACQLPPTCPANPPSREVATCPADASCFALTQCEQIVLCERLDACAPPTCPPTAQTLPACPPGHVDCVERTACSTTIGCSYPDGCAEQSAEALGVCATPLGVRWDGERCAPISGCACVGGSCDRLYPDIATCMADRQQRGCLAP